MRRSEWIPDGAAVAVCLLGSAVLAGWQFDIDPLRRVLPGYVSMNPFTAACFIAAGVSLWFSGSAGPRYRMLAFGLAFAIFVSVSLFLAAMAGWISHSPDQIAYGEAVNADDPPSRMAVSTALGFLLAAPSLVLIGTSGKRCKAAAQYFAAALFFIAIFAAVAYLYGGAAIRHSKLFPLMALHTSAGFLVLSLGLLFKTTDVGWMSLVVSKASAGKLLVLMLPAAIIVPTVLGMLCLLAEQNGYITSVLALTLLATLSMILLIMLTFLTAREINLSDQERHRRHELLRASEARLSGILSIAADAIISVDSQQRITLFNTWAEKIFGYSTSEVLGRPLDILMPRRFRGKHEKHIGEFERSSVAARRMADRQEIFARRKDGEEFPAEASISKLMLDGQPVYTVVLRDMTEQRLVATALIRAKDQAEAATRSKSEFLANMSHEIRTPLNSISGFAQLLLEKTDVTGELRVQLRKIKDSTAALTTIVNDILDYSKLEEGRLSLSLAPFSPVVLARTCVSMMSSIANRRDLSIAITEAPELAGRSYLGDSQRLQQVLLNLLSNAVKFTNYGGVTVKITDVPGDGGSVLRFDVSDTGIGIEPDHMNRLFQRFSQVDSSISRKYGGTGLGLAICKRLVTLMGGQIGAESTPGQGSTFWFSVPLEPAAALAADSEQVSRRRPFVPRSILLAEDVDLNREVATAMLERAGHRVDVVLDGDAAVKAAEAKLYDLILMDIQMPILDGIAATKKIRQLPGAKGLVPIVAMSASVLPDEIAGFFSAGMNGHIGKPIDWDALLAEVQRQTSPKHDAVA